MPDRTNKLFICTANAKGSTAALRVVIDRKHELKEEKLLSKRAGRQINWVVTVTDLRDSMTWAPCTHMISKVPGYSELCKKGMFTRMMSGVVLQGWPKSWRVPEQSVPVSEFKRETLVFKPDDGAQGEGVTLLLRKSDLERRIAELDRLGGKVGVVQRYISSPMLLDGHKFDFRIYVVVTGGNQPRAFICKEGLVRVCPEPYSKPSSKNCFKAETHLTNYSIAKYSTRMVHAENPFDGSTGTKRLMSAVLAYLHLSGDLPSPEATWVRIVELLRSDPATHSVWASQLPTY